MKGKYWWIKERFNPQLGTYYVPLDRIAVKEANKYERSLYGENIMHRYDTLEDYEAAIAKLKLEGERVRR